MGDLQVSAKLCHSNTPVGQVSLNGIIIICGSFDCIIIIIATTIVINILIMVLLVISTHQMAKFSPSTINGIIIPVNIVIMVGMIIIFIINMINDHQHPCHQHHQRHLYHTAKRSEIVS